MKKIILFCQLFCFVFCVCPDGYAEDDCGNCWLSYCYDYVSHEVYFDLNEDECTGETSMWIFPSEGIDPNFNNYCDGSCPDGYMLDDCNHCWSSFCYTFFNEGLNYAT